MRAILPCTVLSLCLAAAPSPAGAAPADDVEALVAELRQARDAADEELVRELGNLRSREAMEALLEVYELMDSTFMRRAVLQALARMDGVDDAEQPALEHIMAVATESEDRELREAAVDALARCNHLGKAFLAMIVEAPAEDDVRERAMLHHTASPRREDMTWYRRFWSADPQVVVEEEGAPDERRPRDLREVRKLAFLALIGELDERELRVALADNDSRIATAALFQLEGLGWDGLEDAAETFYQSFGNPRRRVAGLEVLARIRGAELAKQLIKDAGRVDTEVELREAIAEVLRGFDDERTDRDLAKLVGKGKPFEKIFALLATRDLDDPKLDDRIRKGLRDKDRDVRLLTVEILAERGDEESIEDLERMVERAEDSIEKAALLDALAILKASDPAWFAELLAFARDDDAEVRNTALRQLGGIGGADAVAVLQESLHHELWSTRLVALEALEALQDPDVIGAIIERLPEEGGRLEREFTDALFRLTGQVFGTNAGAWSAWWADNADGFKIPTASQIRRLERDVEEAQLRQTSKSSFFGIRIESHRVVFIIDVSGSMEEPTRGRYVGDDGDPRLAVAKRELLRCLDGLDKRSLFNIITFSDRARPWSDSIQEWGTESLEQARAYIDRFTSGGSTNLWDPLRIAFDDPDVDTIYVLSDGEPNTGEIYEMGRLRRAVQDLNRNRGVIIHCIAVGGSLDVLEVLADDSGGTYVKFP